MSHCKSLCSFAPFCSNLSCILAIGLRKGEPPAGAAAAIDLGPGHALQIAGTVNYVAVPHTAAFNSMPITVMFWVNTTATDKNGDVYYGDLTVVPNVPDDLANACQVPVLSKLLGQSAIGLPLLDGSKKSCDWKIDADAAQPGAFG